MVLENSDFFIRCHLFWAYWTALKSLKFHLCLPFFRYVAIFKEVFHLFSGYCPFLINLSVLPRIATVLSTANSKCFSITTKKKNLLSSSPEKVAFIRFTGSYHSSKINAHEPYTTLKQAHAHSGPKPHIYLAITV